MSRLSERDLDRLLDGEDDSSEPMSEASPLSKLKKLRDAFANLQTHGAAVAKKHGGKQSGESSGAAEPAMFTWDRFDVLELIGTGGFGEVYRAWDQTLERAVALKLRRQDAGFAPAAGRAFIDEARRIARVRHPNVIGVLGAAIDAGRVGIWTELIDGETLQRRLEWGGALEEIELTKLLKALADALTVIHAAGMVHGDLKPSNVMWDRYTKNYILMDFGAGAWLDESGQAWLTSGSKHYMAPEHERGDALDGRADIYSLGAVIYAAAVGTNLFREVGSQRRLPVARLSRDFNQVLSSMLATESRRRPAAAELSRIAQRLLDAPEARKRQRFRRFAVIALSVTTVLSLIGFGAATSTRKQAEAERNRALAVKSFLLDLLRNPNPYQAKSASPKLEDMFEQAVQQLPEQLPEDPQTSAQLLQQFGRSLNVLGRDESSLLALKKAEAVLQGKVPDSNPTLRDARSNLADLYRIRGEFSKAKQLAAQQVKLCQLVNDIEPLACLALHNDLIESLGFSGETQAALDWTEQTLRYVQQHRLGTDYEAVFVHYLRGLWLRELGRSGEASNAFLYLSDQTIAHAPQTHPGLLTDLMLLSWSAFDNGDLELAKQLNANARQGREAVFSATSRYVYEVRLQSARIQLAAGDVDGAKREFRALYSQIPLQKLFDSQRQQAQVWMMLADDEIVLSTQDIEKLELFSATESSLADAELQLLWSALLMRRQRWDAAHDLLEKATENLSLHPKSVKHALRQNLEWHLAKHAGQQSSADDLKIELLEGLAQSPRMHFDPVQRQWMGHRTQEMRDLTQKIAQMQTRILARRAGSSTNQPE